MSEKRQSNKKNHLSLKLINHKLKGNRGAIYEKNFTFFPYQLNLMID